MRPEFDTTSMVPTGTPSFAPASAGALMDVDAVVIRSSASVAAALRYLRMRRHLPANADRLFLLTEDGHFRGSVPFTRLVTAATDVTVETLLEPEAPAIDPDTPDIEVAQLFQEHDLVSAAVVARDGIFLGCITADDVIDVIQRDADVALRRIHHVSARESLFSTALGATAWRTPWLGIGLTGAAFTGLVVSGFESTITNLPLLAAFMPVIASMGGIAATQTTTLTIRGLARGRLHPPDTRWLLRRELAVAALNGIFFGTIVATLAAIAFGQLWLGAIVGGALFLALLAAASVGTLVPMMLTRCRIDPVFAASFVTTATDVIGYALLLGSATLLLS